MEFFETIKERVSDFLHQNTKLAVTIIAILVFLFVSGLIVLLYQLSKIPLPVKPVKKMQETYSPAEEYFSPAIQELTDGYYFSHSADSTDWNEWFTEPGEEEINDLASSNDAFIESILGAAP